MPVSKSVTGLIAGTCVERGEIAEDDLVVKHIPELAGTVYEDAEDGTTNGWEVYDNDPVGAVISNVYDDVRLNYVIELSGSGKLNGYRLKNEDGSKWHNTDQFFIEWSMAYSEFFQVFFREGKHSLDLF